jgi:hypothetical protein
MKATDTKVFQVSLVYNIEADTALKAIDKVVAAHPITPISVGCEPLTQDDEDECY